MRIELRITEQCNFNCSYCTDLHNNKVLDKIINFEELKLVLDQFLDDDLTIFIFGGEPTLYLDFNNLIYFLNSCNNIVEIIVQTNGKKKIDIPNISPGILKLNYSFHPEFLTLTQFIENINTKFLNEISVMYENENSYSMYLILKQRFKNMVQLCPVINPNLNQTPSTELLKSLATRPFFNKLGDYHFLKHRSGFSNFDYWNQNLTYSKSKKCYINFETLYLSGTTVYECFNGLINNINGIKYSEYKYTKKEIICPYERCYFDMDKWEENYDKDLTNYSTK